MTRSQSLAVREGLMSYAAGYVSAQAAEGHNGDVLHLTGQPIPVNSELFSYAEFDASAGVTLVNTKIGSNDPRGPKLDYGGTTRNGTIETNGAHSDWYPVKNRSDADVIANVRAASRLGGNVMLLSRLNDVMTIIDASAGTPTAIDLTSTATKAVKLLQDTIDLVRLACGGFCQINLLWGSAAWTNFADHASVQARVSGGATRKEPSSISLEQADMILAKGTRSRLSNAVYNTAKRGQTASNAFMFSNYVYVAAVSPTPDTMDPAAVKLFQGEGDIMTPTFFGDGSGSHEAVKWNWRELAKVTNSGAIKKQGFTIA